MRAVLRSSLRVVVPRPIVLPASKERLVETDRLAHRRLDVQRLDVLPVLLEQGDEEVDACVRGGNVSSRFLYHTETPKGIERKRTQHDVAKNLVVGHLDVADGDTQAENLLKLELDRRADLVQLVAEVLSVRDGGGELARLGETGAEQTGDLLDEGLGGKESVVALSELLDELLVLVEPGQGQGSA